MLDTRILQAVTIFVALGGGSAFSADLPAPRCDCFVPAVAAGANDPVGALEEVSGRVVVTGPEGPRRGVAGAGLILNEQVATGPRSAARVRVAHCEHQLSAHQELTVQRASGGICLIASAARPGAIGALPPPAFSPAPVLAGLGALALTGGAIALLNRDNDDVWLTFGDEQPISR